MPLAQHTSSLVDNLLITRNYTTGLTLQAGSDNYKLQHCLHSSSLVSWLQITALRPQIRLALIITNYSTASTAQTWPDILQITALPPQFQLGLIIIKYSTAQPPQASSFWSISYGAEPTIAINRRRVTFKTQAKTKQKQLNKNKFSKSDYFSTY